MTYLWVKWLHVVSSTILFGTGIGIAFFKWHADRREDVAAQAAVLRIVVKADWYFTSPAVIVQLATGLWLAKSGGWFAQPWTHWALALYFFAGACWLPVVWLQMRMRVLAEASVREGSSLTDQYHRYRRRWIMLGALAFPALLVVFYLMVFKPSQLP